MHGTLASCWWGREHQLFNRDCDLVQRDWAQYIVPTAVPAFPFRFWDNLVGAAIGKLPIEALQSLHTQLYDQKDVLD